MTSNKRPLAAAIIAALIAAGGIAHAAPAQTTGTGGFSTVCDAGTNPTTGQPIPCPASAATNPDAAQATGGESVAIGPSATASGG